MTNGQMINISKIKRLPLRGTDCTQQCDGGTMLAQAWIAVGVRNEERARRDYVSAAAPKSESDMVEGVDREELVALLEVLRAEEEDHLARLRSMLYGLEAGRPVVAKWLRSIHRLVPTGSLH